MKKSIIIYIFFLPFLTYCQLFTSEIGIINDTDGYTLIREGTTTSYPIKDTIFEKEFFQFIPNDTIDWYQVRKWEHKYSDSDSIDWIEFYKKEQIPGFVHKSRIVNIINLNKNQQFGLIDSLFNLEIGINNNIISEEDIYENRSISYEEIYTPVLQLFVNYMCEYKDEELFRKFRDILIINAGSAYETPWWTLGFVYLCHPKMVLKYIQECESEGIYDGFEFGFYAATSGREDEIENYIELKKEIEKLTTTNNR